MVFSDFICRPLQKWVFKKTGTPLPINSDKPRAVSETVLRTDGIRYVSEISFESQYPNGYLDIYYCPESGSHPTILYWHGGGFIFGDKVNGDPMAVQGEQEIGYLGEICRHGYNVVNINYALAPQYRHPVQIRQVNEAVAFCLKNAEKLGLDMERVFLCGGSAGAILAEMYGMAVVDETYAARLGFQTALPQSKLRGIIIDEAPTDYLHYNSRSMDHMINTWMGTNNLKKCENALTLDVPKFVKDKYPPCCLISSNEDHFFVDAARQLIAKLEPIGADYVHYYVPAEVEKLEHGFMNRFATNEHAAEAFQMTLDFLDAHRGEADS